ncbi:MAG TPA: M28 family peptidase [Gemmatimonadaceae bacterium]|nr:M28 family peptidase [Gemmatimonadaceae bacterium]
MRRTTIGRVAPAALVLAATLAGAAAACTSSSQIGPDTGATPAPAPATAVDSARLLGDLTRLADDSMRGRAVGSPEGAEARAFIAHRFDSLGLGVVGDGRVQPFTFTRRDSTQVQGANVVGVVRGTAQPDRYIVVSAHYDHVGVGRPVNGDSIYNGADDNASGTAALLALAEWFAQHPARHSLLFVAFDGEEAGLRGARAFVADPPVPLDRIALNVNMDMVSHSERGELYVAGAAHYPQLRAPLERVALSAPIVLLLGHDRPQPTAHDDWTNQSDQGAFHAKGIPFAYFGVEDHPDYHRPSDEPDTITPRFYVGAVRTVLEAVRALDGAVE